MKIIDETGNKSFKLIIIKRAQNNKYGEACWECLCDCGNIAIITGSRFRRGQKSCGCLLRKKKPIKDRLMSKVEKTDSCWLWTGAKLKKNVPYGLISIKKGKIDYVHRVSYELFHGEIPEGLEVRHSCHQSLCVNPEHLSVGTRSDNEQDKVKANRYCKFLKGYEKLAPIIMDLHERGMMPGQISREILLSDSTVRRIIKNVENSKDLGKNLYDRV